MAIIGFGFTKINAEKKGALSGKIDINNNVAVTDIKDSAAPVGGSSQKVAKIMFDFDVNYGKVGSMKFSGELMYLSDAKKIEELIESWEKSKSLPKEVAPGIINTILNKCNVQALILSQQVSLPSPIPMPKVSAEAKK